ncbi:MAG: type II toxin-antitoxin system MqsR family toxin [Actinobacteria bacterium]|nr:type II toxin-antitoxin system MqsR family toxin [Actinomycetota bacterium]
MDRRSRVVLFLELMKLTARSRFVFVGRRKNLDTLAMLGMTREHAQSLVLGLTPDNYVGGPDADHNHPGLDVWVFGLGDSGHEVYVKLQVIPDPAACLCVSFHESERPLHYPLREAQPPESEESQQ